MSRGHIPTLPSFGQELDHADCQADTFGDTRRPRRPGNCRSGLHQIITGAEPCVELPSAAPGAVGVLAVVLQGAIAVAGQVKDVGWVTII